MEAVLERNSWCVYGCGVCGVRVSVVVSGLVCGGCMGVEIWWTVSLWIGLCGWIGAEMRVNRCAGLGENGVDMVWVCLYSWCINSK